MAVVESFLEFPMVEFTKYQGAGNDYLFIDALAEQRDWPRLAKAMSDRHFGVGADGIILAAPSKVADAAVRMRIFNADGSEGEMCGNGLRCFAKFVIDRDLVAGGRESLNVETGAGVLTVEPLWDAASIVGARVNMGEPILRAVGVPTDPSQAGESDYTALDVALIENLGLLPSDLMFDAPVQVGNDPIFGTAVSMGNPHFVSFLDTPVYDIPLDKVGPLVEHHAVFPNRVNWSVVNIKDRGHLVGRTWERGSGITLACGTGVSAVVVAARLHGLVDDHVSLDWPGGTLGITWPGHGQVIMEGDAVEVFSGAFPA
jgi:diaminopimelate epimerase